MSKEIIIKKSNYVFILGTLNKTQSDTIYLRSKIRIKQLIADNPREIINKFKKDFNKFLQDKIKLSDNFANQNIITIDFSETCIKLNKINYFRLEMHLIPTLKKNIEELEPAISTLADDIISFVEKYDWYTELI